MVEKSRAGRRRMSCEEECGSLAWLLDFRLDELLSARAAPPSPAPPPPAAPFRAGKPPYTYPELIERALRDKGQLTVSGIYHWISSRFPYYAAHDERWKNSVRHNLSINPHFRKGARASHGAGHLWTLAASALDLLPDRPERPERGERLAPATVTVSAGRDCPKVIVLDEAALAAASILPDHQLFSGSTVFLNPVSSEQVARECGLLVVD